MPIDGAWLAGLQQSMESTDRNLRKLAVHRPAPPRPARARPRRGRLERGVGRPPTL